VLPAFDPESGRLPPGEHVASWDEVVERFGWTERRRRLLDGLAEAIELLAEAGCRQIWLNGSFVTAKDEPGDFDACWDTDGVDLAALDTVMLDLSNHRAAQKARFGWELFPNVIETQSGLSFVEFFQNERDTSRKGIVLIHLSKAGAS
jgi:hypothetical protein